MQLLHNQMERLAAITIDSQWIVTGIDFASKLLEIVNAIVDKVGSLPAIMGTLVGGIAGITNNGIFSLVGKTGDKGAIKNYFDARKQLKDFNNNQTNVYKSQDLTLFSKLYAEEGEQALTAKEAIVEAFGGLDTFFGKLSSSAQDKMKQGLWDKIKDDSMTASELVEQVTSNAGEAISNSIIESQSLVNRFHNTVSTIAKTTGQVLANAALGFGVSALAGFITSWAMKAFDDLVHHSENVIKAGEEAKEQITKFYKEIDERSKAIKESATSIGIKVEDSDTTKKTLDEIAVKYAELKKGVNEFTNANKSLTTDKYKEYLTISNQLAQQFPSLVRGYDEQGNAIIALSGDADTCKESLQGVYEATLNIAHVDITGQIQTAFEGIREQANKARKEIEKLNEDIADAQEAIEVTAKAPEIIRTTTTGILGNEKTMNGIEFYSEEQFQQWYQNSKEDIIRYAEKNNEDTEWVEEELEQWYWGQFNTAFQDLDTGLAETVIIPMPKFSFFSDDKALSKSLKESADMASQKLAEESGKALKESYDNLTLQKNKIKSANLDLNKYMQQFLTTDTTFINQNDTLTKAVLANLSEWTINDVGDDQEIDAFINENIVDKIASITDEVQGKIADVLNQKFDETNVNEYYSGIFNNVNSIVEDETLTRELLKMFGVYGRRKEIGETKKTILNSLSGLGFTASDFENMSLGELDSALSLVSSTTYTSIETFWNDLHNKVHNLTKDGVLNDIFNDTNFQNQSKTLTDALTAITTAIGGAVGGQVQGSAQTALRDALKDVSDAKFGNDYSVENVQKVGVEQLQKYLDLFYKTAEAQNLSDKEMAEANTFIMNMVKSYETLGITANDVIDSVADNYAHKAKDQLSGKRFGQKFREEFKDELGDDTKRQILFSLQANTESADWKIEKWREMYDQAVVTWQLAIDMTEFNKQMALVEARLSLNDEKNASEDLKIQEKQRQGDYDTTNELGNKIENNEDSVEDLQKQLDALFDANNEQSVIFKYNNGQYMKDGSFDSATFRKDLIERREKQQKLLNQIAQKQAENDTYYDDIEFIDIDKLDHGVLEQLNTAYEELKQKVGEYGDTLAPASLLSDLISTAQAQIDSNKEKIDLAQAILDTEGISEELRKKAEDAKEAATKTISTLRTDINTYAQKLGIGQGQEIITALLGAKETYKKGIENSGQDMTEANYTYLNNLNDSLMDAYDQVINELAEKKGVYEDMIVNGIQLDGIQQADFKALDDLFDQYIGERNALIAENRTNIQASTQLGLDERERNANKYNNTTNEMIASMERWRKNGEVPVTEEMYTSVIGRLATTQTENREMARIYDLMAQDTENYSKTQREGFEDKAEGLRSVADGITDTMDRLEEEAKNLDLDALDIQLARATAEAESMKTAMDNSLRPLESSDYKAYVSELTDELDIMIKKREELEEKRQSYDNENILETSEQYQTLVGQIEALDKALASLGIEIKTNKDLAENVDFDRINEGLERTNTNISDLQAEQRNRTNRGERLRPGDYKALEAEYQTSITQNQGGMDEVREQIRDIIIGNGQRIQSVSESFIDQILSGDYSSAVLQRDDVDLNRIKQLVKEYENYYQGRLTAEDNLYQTEVNHEESHANLLQQGLTSAQAVTDSIEKQNDATRQQRKLTQEEIDTQSASYDRQIPILEALQLEYTRLMGTVEKDTPKWNEYQGNLTSVTGTLDDLRDKQYKLNKEMLENGADNLADDMAKLQTEYDKLNGSLGKTASDEDEYLGMINIASAQEMNKLAEATNKEALAQMAKAFGYDEEYKDFMNQAEQARNEAQKYTDQIVELEKSLKALPENRIAATMGVISSKAGMQRAELSYKSTKQNGILSPSDYSDIIRTDKEDVRKQRELVDILSDRRREATDKYTAALSQFGNVDLIPQEVLDEYTKANSDFYQAESDLFQKQEQVSKDYQSASEAILADYDERMRVIGVESATLSNKRMVREAQGKRRSGMEIQAEMKISKQSMDNAKEELKNLSKDDFKFDGWSDEQIDRAFEDAKAKLEADAANAETEYIKLGYELDDFPVTQLQYQLNDLQDDASDTQRKMSDLANQGAQIPQDMLNLIQRNSKEQIETIDHMISRLKVLAFFASFEGNDERAEELRDLISTLEGERSNAVQASLNAEQTAIDQTVAKYQNALERIKEDSSDLSREMSKSANFIDVDEYDQAIAKSREWVINLRSQVDYYEGLAEAMEKQKGFDPNNEKYQGYLRTIHSLNDEIQEQIDNQEAWRKAINNFDLTKATIQIQNYNRQLKELQNARSLSEAQGQYMTNEDYEALNKLYQDIYDEASVALEKAQKDFAFNIHWEIFEPDSEEAKQAQDQIDQFAEDMNNAQINIANNNHEWELLPVTELQRDLAELELVGEEIQRTYDDITAKGGDVSEEQYAVQVQNLNDQKDVLTNIRDIYVDLYKTHKGDAFGADILSSINDVDSKINAINDKEYEIELGIDMKPLNNLQEKMVYLNKEAEDLQTALNDPRQTTMSKEEVLNAIIDADTERLKNLGEQAEQYQNHMQKIKDENPDDYLLNDKYIEAVNGLAGVESQIDDINKEIWESRDAIDAIPIEKINRIIEMYQTMAGLGESRRNLKVAQGEELTSGDYADAITNAEGIIRENQEKRDLAYADFLEKQAALTFANLNPTIRNREVAQTNFEDAYTAYVEADTALNTAQADLARTQAEASEADMKQFQNRIAYLNTLKARIQAEREALEATGYERGKVEIVEDMGISREMSSALQAELDQLDASYLSGDSKKTYLQYLQERQQILSQMKDEEIALINYQKELETIPMKAPEKALKNLKKAGDEIDRIIASFRNVDKEVPDSFLADKLTNIEAQKSQITTIRNFYAGLVKTVGAVFGDVFVEGWKDKVAELDQQLVDLDSQAYNIGKEQDNKAFVHIGYQLDELKEKAKQTQKALEDTTTPKSAEKYQMAIENAVEQQKALTKQINITKEQMAKFTNENDPGYQQLKTQLRSLQDEYSGLAQSVHGWAQALRDLDLSHAITGLEDYQRNLNNMIKEQDNKSNVFGFMLTEDDYKDRADSYQTLAEQEYEIAQKYSKRMAGVMNGSDDYKSYLAEYEKHMEQGREYEFVSRNQSLIDSAKAPIEALEAEMEDLRNQAQTTQNEINALVEAGGVGTEKQYEDVIKINSAQIQSIKDQKKEWEEFRAFMEQLFIDNGYSTEETNKYLKEFDDAILKLDQDTRQLQKDTLEYKLMLNGGIELKGLQDAMTKLTQENTKLNNQISLDQSRSLMVYADSYEAMADNVEAQIDNLRQSNRYLEQQQSTVGITAAKYNELEQQIQSNNSQINGLIQNFDSYNNQLVHFASNYATALQGAINTAINESASNTGLTNQAMDSLLGQFRELSEIAGMDLSNLFYNTAEGIKVNTEELRRLVAVQSTAFSQSVANNIKRETDMISTQTNTVMANGQVIQITDAETLKSHEKKMEALRNELSQYSAIMETIRQSTDSYAQWQQAEQSENSGARYDSLFQGMISMEQRYARGETNTDEFRQFVSMMSANGLGTAEEFEDIYPTLVRYINNNTEGIENFLSDLIDKGFDITNVLDINEVANAFNLSDQAVTMIIDKLRDYGTNIITVTDVLDASSQMLEKNAEYQQLVTDYTNALASGDTILTDKIVAQMATVRSELESLQEYAETMENPIMTEEQYNATLNEINILADKIANTNNELVKSADKSRMDTLQANLFGAGSYEEYLANAEEYSKALQASMPNLFDITDKDLAEYRSGMEQLREIAGDEVIDFYRGIDENTTFQEIADNFKKLHEIKIDVVENPLAQTALDNIAKIVENEGYLRLALDSTGMTAEQLSTLSDEEIIKTVNLTGEKAEEFVQYLHNKANELPVEVKISEDSIDKMSKALSDVKISTDTNTLVDDIQSALDQRSFDINLNPHFITTNSNRGGNTATASASAYGTLGSAFANGTVENGRLAQDTMALVNEVGTESTIDKNGNWNLIPGGMHIEKLSRGDIVLNHKQTEQLMETGKASGHGKVVGGMSAFAGGTQSYQVVQGYANRGQKEMFDQYARLIQSQNQTFQDFSNSLKSYMDVTQKSNILTQEQNNLLEQINTQRGAREAYLTEAQTYRYTDEKSGKETTMDIIDEARKHKVNLADFINGTRSLTELKTETPDDIAFVNAIKHYMEFTDKAKSADRAVYDLNSQLSNVQSTMLKLPFEQMDKALQKIGNTMGAIGAFTNVAQVGETAVSNLGKILHDTFGDEAEGMITTTGSQLDIMFGLIDQNVKGFEDTLNERVTGLEQAKEKLEELQVQRVDQEQRVRGSSAVIRNRVSGLSPEDIQHLRRGERVEGIYDANAQKLIDTYNETVDQLGNTLALIEEGEKDVDGLILDTQKAAADLATAQTNSTKEKSQAIDAYVGVFQSVNDSIANLARARADRIAKYLGYEGNTSEIRRGYQESIDQQNATIDLKRNQLQQKKNLLSEYEYGSIEWQQYSTEINNLESELIGLESAVNDTYEAMLNVPVQEMEEKLKKIEDAYHGYSVALSSGITSSVSNVNAYKNLMAQLGGPNILAGVSGSTPLEMTNALIRMDVERLKEEAVVAIEAYNDALADLEEALASGDPEKIKIAQEIVRSTRNAMNDKTMEASVATVDQWRKQMEEVEKHYQNIISSIDTMINKLKINKQFLEIGNGYLMNGASIMENINQQLAQIGPQRNAYAQSIAQMQAILNQGLASGNIQYGDDTWMNLNNMILTTQNNMENLRLTELQLFEEMANVPNKVVEAKLKDIENAYHAVNAVMSGNIATSLSMVNAYRRIASLMGRDIFAGYGEGTTETQYQDVLLSRDYQRAQAEVEAARAGYDEAYARLWAGGTAEQIRLNSEALNTARNLLDDKIIALATKEVDNFVQGIRNAETYWSNLNAEIESGINGLKIQNQLLEAQGADKNADQMQSNYMSMIDRSKTEMENINHAIGDIRSRIQEGLSAGTIVWGDSTHTQLAKTLNDLQNQYDELRLTQLQWYEEMLQIPEKKLSKILDNLTKKYASLNAVVSSNIADTLSATMQYNNLLREDQARGMYVPADNFLLETDVTYIRQNNVLEKQLRQEEETLKARADALLEAQNNAKQTWATVEQAEKAKETADKAEIEYLKQEAVVAALRARSASERVQNIESYYQSLIDDLEAQQGEISSERDYQIAWGTRYTGNGATEYLNESYDKELEIIQNKKRDIQYQIDKMTGELARGVAEGYIVEGDEQWRKLKNSISSARQELAKFNDEGMKTFNEKISLVMLQLDETIQDLDGALTLFNSMNSAGGLAKSASYMQLAYKAQRAEGPSGYNVTVSSDTLRKLLDSNISNNGAKLAYNIAYLHQYKTTNPQYVNQALDAQASVGVADTRVKLALDAIKDLNNKKYSVSKEYGTNSDEYNNLIKEIEKAQAKYYEYLAEDIDTRIEVARSLQTNIINYYDMLNDYWDTLSNKMDAIKNNLTATMDGYIKNSREILQVSNEQLYDTITQARYAHDASALLQKQLEQSIKDGNIVVNSQEWHDSRKEIEQQNINYYQYLGKFYEQVDELLHLPTEIANQFIEGIEREYSEITSLTSSGVLGTSGGQRLYTEYANNLNSKVNRKDIFRSTNYSEYNAPSFAWQNTAINQDLGRQAQEAAQLAYVAGQYKEMRDELIKGGSYTKTELDLLDAIIAESDKNAQEAVANLAKAQAEAVITMVNNIKSYYDRLNSYIQAVNGNIESTRNYIIETSEYSKNLGRIQQSYVESYYNLNTQSTAKEKEILDIRNQIYRGLKSGSLKQTDDEYIELSNTLQGLESEYINIQSEIFNTYKAFYDLPNQVATEKIDKITKSFINLESAISNANVSTLANQQALKNLANQYAQSNPYINADQLNFALGQQTFLGQNASLALQLKKQEQIVAQRLEALRQAGDNLTLLQQGYNPISGGEATPIYNYKVSGVTVKRTYTTPDKVRSKSYVTPMATSYDELPTGEYTIGVDRRRTTGTKTSSNVFYISNGNMVEDKSNIVGKSLSKEDLLKAGMSLELYNKLQSSEETQDIFKFKVGNYDEVIAENKRLQESSEVTQEAIKAAQDAFDTSQQEATTEITKLAQMQVENAKQNVSNINAYYNDLIHTQETLASRFESTMSVLEQLGRAMDEHGVLITDTDKVTDLYTKQIDALREKEKLLATSIVEQEAEIAKVKDTTGEGTEEYREMQNTLIQLRNEYDSTLISMDKLEDAMRHELYIKPIEEAIQRLETLRANFSAINSLIEEDSKITKEGNYTEQGVLSLTFDMTSYNSAMEQIEKARQEYEIMHERWLQDDSYSDEQYLADRQRAIEAIQKAMSNANVSRQSIMTTIKNRYRTEIDYIKELIQTQSEELAKRKEMDDYDRNLKDKTKSVKQLEAQIRALENLCKKWVHYVNCGEAPITLICYNITGNGKCDMRYMFKTLETIKNDQVRGDRGCEFLPRNESPKP